MGRIKTTFPLLVAVQKYSTYNVLLAHRHICIRKERYSNMKEGLTVRQICHLIRISLFPTDWNKKSANGIF
jgi:hypothetical protein